MTVEKLLVTDTHPLIYFFCDGGTRLSDKARKAFEEATTNAQTSIFVPIPALWELSLLVQNDDIQLNKPYSEWIDDLFRYLAINPISFDESTVKLMHDVRYHTDPFDRAIVASALQMDLALISNDGMMHRYSPCKLFWD